MQYLSPEQVQRTIVETQMFTPHMAFLIHGSPGVGKSQSCPAIAGAQGIPLNRVKSIHLGDYDRVELGGVPEIATHEPTGERITVFRPTDILAMFRKGTGAGVVVLEELGSCLDDIKQFVAQLIEDRKTGNFELDPEVRIIATTNRVEDRAGVKPLPSHLNDRFTHIGMSTSIDDFSTHALKRGVDAMGVAFLRLRPELLNNFDPNQTCSGTPRSWFKLFTEVPPTLPTDLYLAVAEGKVGEGNAAEWVAARDMMHKMPSVDVIRMHPEQTEVPDEAAVQFAIATAMSVTTTPDAFVRDMMYIQRMPKEFQMVYVTDAMNLNPELQNTEAYINWAIANKDIFLGGN